MKEVIYFFFLLFFSLPINAIGIAVSPAELNFNEKILEKEITVFNLNSRDTDYIISVKAKPDYFEISEREFVIEKNNSKKITIKFNHKDNFDDIIYIREKSDNNILPGVGVRVSYKKEFYDGKGFFIGSLVLLAFVLAYIKFKRKV